MAATGVPMPQPPFYRYVPLGANQFRTLHIVPVRGKGLPRLILETRSLGKNDIFDALSYYWGVPTPPTPIEVEVHNPSTTGTLNIRPNLADFLKWCNEAEKELHIFIDQICINQSDPTEKNAQIKCMGRLYGEARHVLVWLGRQSGNEVEYINFVKKICQPESGFVDILGLDQQGFKQLFVDVNCDSTALANAITEAQTDGEARRLRLAHLVQRYAADFTPLLLGLKTLLSSIWFTRLWIIQEMCLGSQVIFHSGDQELTYDEFRAGGFFFTIWSQYRPSGQSIAQDVQSHSLIQAIVPLLRAYSNLCLTRDGVQPPAGLPHVKWTLYRLVKRWGVNDATPKLGATNMTDRIYGLMGMATDDEMLRRFKASMDTDDKVKLVYSRLAEEAIHEEVDLLLYNQGPKTEVTAANMAQIEEDIPWPSWVPDWTSTLNVPRGYSEMNCPAFAAGGTLHPPMALPRADVAHDGNHNLKSATLFIRGIKLGTITAVGVETLQKVQMGGGSIIDPFSAVRFIEELRRLALSAPSLTSAEAESAEQVRNEVRFLVGGMLDREACSRLDELVPCHEAVLSFFKSLKPGEENENSQNYRRALLKSVDRKMFITDQDLKGLGPKTADSGDILVIFFGGSVPHLLRPTDPAKNGMVQYRYLGEAYCDGVMDGEALREDKYKESEFQLV